MSETKLKIQQALGSNINPPQGYVINGKIAVTVATNNLTVAIKTLAGNDPSTSDPVIVRIGDTVRTITAALSVTKNAGTNWFNAGSAELATKEIDYFVYLGYNATDGVVIGFARVPYVTRYDGFSTTTTSEKYCAISTITNAAAGDYYEVIGRFAATLSAGAGYTWSVPTFTANNLIQRPIYETRVLTSVPTRTGGGSMTIASTELAVCRYKVAYDRCEIVELRGYGQFGGTPNPVFSLALPFIVGGVSAIPTIPALVVEVSYSVCALGYIYLNDNVSLASISKATYANWGTGTTTGLMGAQFNYAIK